MKKYAIIIVFISIVFTGCSRNSWQEMSFTQASDMFFHNSVFSQDMTKNIWLTWVKSLWLSLGIFWENRDFKLNLDTDLSWDVDYNQNLAQTKTQATIKFEDKTQDRQNHISWNISNRLIDQKVYSILEDFYIDIWSGNYQSDLFKLIAQNLEWKRIQSQINNDKIKIFQNIKSIINIISSAQNFDYVEAVTYDWLLAYKIQLNSQAISQIKAQTDIEINSFDCLLVVHSSSNVELKLQQVEFKTPQNTKLSDTFTKIKWTISHKDIDLTISSSDKPEEQIKFKLEKHKRHIYLSIESLLHFKKMLSLNIKLQPKIDQDTANIQINGIVSISPLIVYWSDLEKNIEIDINGQYYFSDIEGIDISQPDSFILGWQILWDDYSLETLLSN